jgi:hypothetical protein
MKKTDLIFSDDGTYLTLKDNLSKNHRGGDLSLSTGSKLFATNDASNPLSLVKHYLENLHEKCIYLWQRPKDCFKLGEPSYCCQKIGINYYSKFMNEISTFCQLSRKYTNHCVRSTDITCLGDKYEDTDVKTMSGHKSLSALGCYKRTSDNKIQKMSNTLHESIYGSSSMSDNLHESIYGSSSMSDTLHLTLNEGIDVSENTLPELDIIPIDFLQNNATSSSHLLANIDDTKLDNDLSNTIFDLDEIFPELNQNQKITFSGNKNCTFNITINK